MSAKKGLCRLAMTMPSTRLRPPARVRACRFGLYFKLSTARRTFARVELLTPECPLSTRETVALPTPARFATSSRFISPVLWSIAPIGKNQRHPPDYIPRRPTANWRRGQDPNGFRPGLRSEGLSCCPAPGQLDDTARTRRAGRRIPHSVRPRTQPPGGPLRENSHVSPPA